jgi:hypothetical protein
MKNRVRKVANFFAFNLLFFALYLNFIHKDRLSMAGTQQNVPQAAFSGAVLIDNPEQVIEQKSQPTVSARQTAPEKITENNTNALRLSIN